MGAVVASLIGAGGASPAAALADAAAHRGRAHEASAARGEEAQAELPERDPWFPELRALVETESDAYFDKPHPGRFGGTAGELPSARAERLDGFTREVLAAVRDRASELGQYGDDAAWKYAATLVWIAHRDTRIASDPSKLGNQDEGRAHGYWQIWSWRGMDPYRASTALDMLLADPGRSWSVPKGHPWTGYPACAAWLAAHPEPSRA